MYVTQRVMCHHCGLRVFSNLIGSAGKSNPCTKLEYELDQTLLSTQSGCKVWLARLN